MTIMHKRTKQFEKYIKKPFEFRKAAFITEFEKTKTLADYSNYVFYSFVLFFFTSLRSMLSVKRI